MQPWSHYIGGGAGRMRSLGGFARQLAAPRSRAIASLMRHADAARQGLQQCSVTCLYLFSTWRGSHAKAPGTNLLQLSCLPYMAAPSCRGWGAARGWQAYARFHNVLLAPPPVQCDHDCIISAVAWARGWSCSDRLIAPCDCCIVVEF